MLIKDIILEISDSGKFAEIRLENGRIIAQFLIHGLLKRVAENCMNGTEIISGRPNIFRGELYQLAPYEYLNDRDEQIEEKV